VVTIKKINLKQQDAVQKKFLKNISTVLSKIGTSHKTKAISSLVRSESLYIGYGITDISRKRNAEFGIQYLNGNKLSGLAADISAIVDASDLQEVARKVKDIEKANKELSRIKTTITDTSALQMKNLDTQIEKLFNDLLDSIDYFTLVDVYYYLYINTLTIIGLKGNGKNKIFETSYEVFKKVITKILSKAHNEIKNEDRTKFDVVIDFMFARVFTEQSAQTILGKLTKLYSEEDVAFLKEMKLNDLTEFKNIATVLTKAGIANITETALMSSFAAVVGEGSKKSMDGEFDELVAYVISTNYKSSLFDAQKVAPDEQERLEQLILNFKKDMIISGK
jgi:hypothetical protein